jgi:hypothetical protein
MFLYLSKSSLEAQESSLNLPRQLTQIAYPISLLRITLALPERLTQALPKCLPEPYLSTLPDHVLLTQPYPIALPDRVTPYQLCPRSFTQAGNLPSLSLVDPTLSLSAQFGLRLTRPTTCFTLLIVTSLPPYQPLTLT